MIIGPCHNEIAMFRQKCERPDAFVDGNNYCDICDILLYNIKSYINITHVLYLTNYCAPTYKLRLMP